MSKSNRLKLSEVRQALRLVGECRDLGASTREWYTHALLGARQLLGANVVLGGLAGPTGLTLCSQLNLLLSVGWETPEREKFALDYLMQDQHLRDPAFQRFQAIARPNITLRPLCLISRKAIETSEYHAVRKSLDLGDMLYSQREEMNRVATFSFSPQRPVRERSFTARESKLLRLLHDELALLVGNVLCIDSADPLAELSPRLRETLTLLLTGDSEKQVALRMGLSRHTVHDYVVALYKHFRVNSRASLMAHCRRRGIGGADG